MLTGTSMIIITNIINLNEEETEVEKRRTRATWLRKRRKNEILHKNNMRKNMYNILITRRVFFSSTGSIVYFLIDIISLVG